MAARITLKQVRYLVALADRRHFRKAADAVGVTQPSLSAQIADLEALLGLRLVERGKGPVTLTVPGRAITARARRIMDEVQGLEDLAVTLQGGTAGSLRLGSSLTIGPYLLPAVLRRLHRAHPDLSLYMGEGTPIDLEAELLAGGHDILLTQLPVRGSAVQSLPLFREPLMLVVPAGHALAGRARVGPGDLDGLDMLTLGPKYALTTRVLALCLDTGVRVVAHYEGSSLDSLRLMVGMEMGVAVMPALYVRSELRGRDPSVVAIPFGGGRFHRTIGLAWRTTSGRTGAFDILHDSLSRTVREEFSGSLADLGSAPPSRIG